MLKAVAQQKALNAMGRTALAVETVVMKRGAFLAEFEAFLVQRFMQHHLQDRMQAASIEMLKSGLTLGELLALTDFAMNYGARPLERLSLHHWSCVQVTLLIFCVWRVVRVDGRLEVREEVTKEMTQENHIFVSPDGKHSNQFVQHCMDQLVDMYEALAGVVSAVKLTSDNCGGQYKQREHFGYLLRLRDGRELLVTHTWSCPNHGKGQADAEAGSSKGALERAAQRHVDLSTAPKCYEYLAKTRTVVPKILAECVLDYERRQQLLEKREAEKQQAEGGKRGPGDGQQPQEQQPKRTPILTRADCSVESPNAELVGFWERLLAAAKSLPGHAVAELRDAFNTVRRGDGGDGKVSLRLPLRAGGDGGPHGEGDRQDPGHQVRLRRGRARGGQGRALHLDHQAGLRLPGVRGAGRAPLRAAGRPGEQGDGRVGARGGDGAGRPRAVHGGGRRQARALHAGLGTARGQEDGCETDEHLKKIK